MNKSKGFAFIELLVVIAVLALLVGILLPSLTKVKEQAKSVFCLNNLKQMAVAAENYAISNSNYYPIAYYTERIDGIRYYYSWDFTTYKDWKISSAQEVVKPGILWEGQTLENVQQCPSFKGSHKWFADPYTGYNYNTSYIGINETVSPVNSARTTQIRSTSGTVLFGDGQYSEGANKFMRAPFSNPRDASFSDPARATGTQGFRHMGKSNTGFSDGHAESRKDLFTNMDPVGQNQLDKYNEKHDEKIGFLSMDNRIYDLN